MAEAKYTIKVELDDKTLRNSVLNTQEFIQKKLGSGNMIEIDLGTADIKEAEKAIDRMCGKSKELAAAMKKAFAEQRIAPLQKESKMFGEIKELFGNTNKTQGNVTKAIITQLNNEIKKAGKTGDSAELISAIKDMLIKINSAKDLGFGKDNGFSKVDGRKLFAPYNFNDIYNDVVKGITTNLRETFSAANGTLDSAVGDLLNWMDNVGKRTSIDHKGFDSVDKIIKNLNDQLSSVSNFSDVAVDVIEQSTKEVEKVAKAAEDAQKALKKTKPSSKKKNAFEGLDEDDLENAFYDITDKDAENKKFTKKDQQDLTQILGAARKFGEEYVDNLLMGVDQLKEDVNREMIETIMDSLETLSPADKSARILPEEIKDLSNDKMLNDFIASVRDVRKNLKEYKDYLEVIYDLSEITKDLGEGSLAEVGYNGRGLISYGTGGRVASTYANKTMEIDYHSHPITKIDQLLPSFEDIISYIEELKNVDKNGNPYLKEAYISTGDKILKMDFSQIDFSNLNLDDFGKEIADSMANAMKKAGAKIEWNEEEGMYEDKTRSVLVDRYATAAARRALGDTLAKHGGSLSTAVKNSDGQFIDTVTGKAWKARGSEDVSDSLTSAAMSLTEQIEMLERTIREIGGNISVSDKNARSIPQKSGRIPKAEIANYDRAQSLIKFLNDQVEVIRKTHVEGGKSEASVDNNTYVSELKSMITMLKHYVNGAREFKYDNELLEWAKTQFIPTKFNEKTVKNADGIDIKISEPVEATLDELKAIIDKKWNEVFDALTDGGDVLGQFEKKVSTSSSQVANLGRKIEPEIVEVEDALVDAIATIENKAKEVGRSVDNYQGLAKMKKDLENIQKYKRGDKLDKEGTNYINSVLNKTGMSQNEYIRKEGVRFEDALLTKNQFASLVRGIKTYFVGEVTGSKSTKKSEMSEEQIAEVNAKTKELTNLFNELNIQTQGEAKAWREALKFGNSAREIINIYRQTVASNLEGRRSDSWKPTYQKYKEDMSKNPTGSLATAEDLEKTRQIAETRADAIDSAVEGIVKAEERITEREADIIGPSGMRTSLQSNKPLISTEKRVIYGYNDGNESGRPDKIITEYQKSVEDSCDNILANIARYKSEAINNLLLGDFNYERNKKTGEVNIVRQLTSREKDKLRKEEEEAQKDIIPVDTKDPNQVLADFRVEEKEYNEKRIEEAKKLLELKEQEYAAEKERVDRINAEEQSLSKEEYIRARMSDKIAEMEEEAIKQLNNEGNGSAVERQRIYDLSMQDIDYFKNRMNGDISENIEAVKDKSAKELHQTLNELFDERKKTQEEIQKLNDVMTAATQGESGKKSRGKNLSDSNMKALERTLMENAEAIRQTSFERDFKDAVIFEEGRVDDKGNYVETTGRLVQLEEEMAELRKITNQTNEKVKKVAQKPRIVKAPIEPEPEPEIVRPVAPVPTAPVNTDVAPTGNVVINTDQAEINTKTTDSENIDNAKAINIGSGGKLNVNGTNATTAPAQKAKSKNEVKTVDDERIRSLYQQFIRYQNDSSVQGNKDIYNTLQGLLEDINDFRYSTKSEKQFKNIVNRTDNFKFEIEALKQLNKMYDDTYDRRRKIAELEATGENPELLKQLKDAQDAAENQMRNWAKGLKFGAADIDDTWIANVIGKKDEVEDYAKDLIRRITSVRTSIDNAMKQKTQTGYGYTEEFKINVEQVRDNANAVILQLSNIGEAGENTAEILKNAEQIIETLGQQRISVNSSETVTKKVTQVQDLLNKASNLINNTGMLGVDSGDREKMYNVYGQLKAITDAAKDAESEMTTISRIDYDRLDEQLKELELKYKQLGNYGVNAFQRISRSLKAQMAAQFARYFSLYDLIRYVRTGVNTIKELDTAMVELRKVTDGTAQEYANFRNEIRATATEIAATNKDLISSSADWARLGYSIKEATELAKDAQIFVNVGDGVDIKGATDMMITAMKAFNIEAGEALSIVDKYNEIGNHFALSATDIGDAMQRSASVLAASNTSFNESIALITAADEILQDPEKVGTALRTIALRIRGAKSELEEMGEETDYIVNSTSKLRDLIKAYTSINGKYEGFDIMEDEDTFKSLADIIKGIGRVYDEMSDIDRTAMLEKLAGKNRSNALAAMLQNYEQIDNVLKSIDESEGSALEENAHVVDSIQGRLTILQTSGENFWQAFLDTDTIKETVTGLTNILDVLTKIVDKAGSAPLLTLFTGGALVGKSGSVQRLFQGLNDRTALNISKDLYANNIKQAEDDLTRLNSLTNISEEEFGDWSKSVDAASASLNESSASLKGVEKSLEGVNAGISASLKSALMGFGITAIISVITYAISSIIQKEKEAIQAAHDLAKENKNTNDSLSEYAKRISDARKVIDDEKSSLEEVRNAKNELITVQNELNQSYDNYSQILNDTNASLREQNQLLIENALLKNKETINAAKEADGLFTNSEYEKAIEAFEKAELKVDTQTSILKDYAENSELFTIREEAAGSGNYTAPVMYFNSTGDRNEDIKLLTQLRNSITETDSVSQDTIKELDRLIKDINESRDEYEDIYLAYAENETANRYNDEYNSLMQAYFSNVQDGTEETEQILRQELSDLWEKAASENDAGVQYWLRSMFGEFFDTIDDMDFQAKWDEVVDGQVRGDKINRMVDIIQSGSEEDIALTADQMRQYLNGINISASDRQKEWLDMLKDYINENGLLIDDVIEMLAKEGKVRTGDGRYTFEDDLKAFRDQAISDLGMSGEDFDALGIGTNEELEIWKRIVLNINDASDAVKEYALETSNLGKNLDASDVLKNMESQYDSFFGSLSEAYKSIFKEDGGYSIEKVTSKQLEGVRAQIESINENLSQIGEDTIPTDAIDNFILTLSDASTDADKAHEAFNELATSVVDSLYPSLSNASGATAQLMINTLKEMGVINAEAVVYSRLGYSAELYAEAKEEAASIGYDLDDDISSLDAETKAQILASETLMDYYQKVIIANAEHINTTEDVEQLINLCDQLGITIVKLDKLNQLRILERDINNSSLPDSVRRSRQNEYDRLLEETVAEFRQHSEVDWEDPQYDAWFGDKESGTSSGSDSKQKFDWIERAIKKIQRAVTNLGKVADATYKTWGERLDAIMGKTEEFHDELGRYGAGNIDLYNRPQYINEDGSVSTVRSMSFGDEFGNEILVPTIAFDNNGNPYSMSDDEAIARYYETGEYLGLFKSIEEAEEYAEKLHEQQEAIYTGNDSFYAGKYQKLKEQIALQEQAAQAYMAEANAIGLSAEYRSKVMNGLMDIETITNEKLKEQISDFQEYYDKATDAADAVEDLRAELAQLAQTKFDMITKQFEEMALVIDHAATRIGHIQSKLESEGYFESSALITQLKAGTEERLGQLKEEAKQLAASIDEAVTNGDIEYGSEQWWGMWDALQNVNDEIVEATSSLADYNDQLRQMEWDNFDYIADAVHGLVEENEFLIDVLQDEQKMFEKNAYIGDDMYANGNMSDAALAVQGLHVNSLKVYEEENKKYADEIKKINAELAKDPNNKKLLERRKELIEKQRESIKGISSEKKAIIDLIKEGYETFLDYLQKSIDKRKQILEAQKSLYDYEKNIKEQTKAIATYQKQLAALGGDTSEENKARLQELADNLNKAEEELQDTEYERWLSDQEEMMDELYSDFEKLIDDKLDKVDELIERAISQTEKSATDISKTVEDQADELVYDLSNTSFGVNMDARMSDAITAIRAVEGSIATMIDAANINAQNELASLSALAQTVATQAMQRAAQIPQATVPTGNTGNGGNGGGSKGGTKTTPSSNDKQVGDNESSKRKSSPMDEKTMARISDLQKLIEITKQEANRYTPVSPHRIELDARVKEYEEELKELQRGRFAQGGTIGKAIRKTGEDGIILARSGEEVLSLDRVKQMQNVFKMMQPLADLSDKGINPVSGGTTVNGMNISFDLPNVTNYEDFVNQARKDPRFEKLVQSMTIGTSLGKSSLSKYSI